MAPPVLLIDAYETTDMETKLGALIHVTRVNLVHMGVGDYYWDTGTRYSLEHKSGDQAVSESGKRLDSQLRKHMNNSDVVGLVISNVVSPSPKGNCLVWRKDWLPTGTWRWRKLREVKKPYTAYQAYLWQLQQAGVFVFQFDDRDSMALGIASFVYNSQKQTHSTLLKHQRPIVAMAKKKVKGWKPNPYIETLMGIRGGGLGEKRATKLIEKYKTPHAVYNADVQEIFNLLGKVSGLKLLKAIGRF